MKKKEITVVNEVSNSIAQMGKRTREIEQKIFQLFAKKNGTMVNSGSSILLLEMNIVNLPKESEVITLALTSLLSFHY
ncbi:MAG: DegT/DnrJ/EryC1/StrS family aminotransferase [Proteobacteria bacterium]|nr:DegT/DnrJ/EryC1/StrS family aminotransferase [Pseudomonadota bacterium]